jgi:hypothetical protein
MLRIFQNLAELFYLKSLDLPSFKVHRAKLVSILIMENYFLFIFCRNKLKDLICLNGLLCFICAAYSRDILIHNFFLRFWLDFNHFKRLSTPIELRINYESIFDENVANVVLVLSILKAPFHAGCKVG